MLKKTIWGISILAVCLLAWAAYPYLPTTVTFVVLPKGAENLFADDTNSRVISACRLTIHHQPGRGFDVEEQFGWKFVGCPEPNKINIRMAIWKWRKINRLDLTQRNLGKKSLSSVNYVLYPDINPTLDSSPNVTVLLESTAMRHQLGNSD